MNTIPRATYDRFGDVELRFPYDRQLVDALKIEIPAHARSYDPDDKVWTVDEPYAALAERLLLRRFPGARIEHPSAGLSRGVAQPFAVLHLLPSAPPELIDAAYRTLARLRHPDAGGTNEAMRELNAAREALSELVSA